MVLENPNANYVDGEGAESFVEMFTRMKDMWDKWQSGEEEHVAVFCHSMFIYVFDLLLRLGFKVQARAQWVMTVRVGQAIINAAKTLSSIFSQPFPRPLLGVV